MNELQKCEFNILQKTINFLNKNNLNYFLVGGSLLGAIRHKGFIPWDDDIDIGMRRDDYEKLIEICRENDGYISENLQFIAVDLGNSIYPYAKIIDKSIKIKSENGLDDYLWLDIFPFEFLPESNLKTVILYKREKFLEKMLYIKNLNSEFLKETSKNRVKYFFKKVIYNLVLKRIENYSIAEKMSKIAKKVNEKNKNSKYSGCLVWGYGKKEKILTEDLDLINMSFEGKEVTVIKGYDNYMRALHGDYMKLPPEEKRVSHKFQIIKLDK